MTTVTAEDDLKKQIGALGVQVTSQIEDWRKADEPARKALEDKIKAIETKQEKLQGLLEQTQRAHIPGVQLGNGEKGKYSMTRLARLMGGLAKSDDKEYGYEVEVDREMHGRLDSFPAELKTAINASSGATGAFLISTEINAELLKELEAATIASMLGMQTMTGLTSNISWNRDLGGISAAYLDSEAEATGSESVPTFGNMELKPHVYAAFVPLTFGMITQPAMNIEAWVRSRMAYKIGLLKDLSVFLGTGANSQPRGLKLSGITEVDFTTSPTLDVLGSGNNLVSKLMLIGAQLPMANAVMPGAKFGFATGPFVVNTLGASTDVNERPMLWTSNNTTLQNGPMRLTQVLGTPLKETTQLNASSTAQTTEDVYYGDFNQVGDFNWGTLAFASSDSTETNFRKLRVTVRAVGAHDIGVFYPACFVRGKSFNATLAGN